MMSKVFSVMALFIGYLAIFSIVLISTQCGSDDDDDSGDSEGPCIFSCADLAAQIEAGESDLPALQKGRCALYAKECYLDEIDRTVRIAVLCSE